MARRDDSNKFVVTVTAFNNLSRRDPLLLATVLAVAVVYGLMIYDQYRKLRARDSEPWQKSMVQ